MSRLWSKVFLVESAPSSLDAGDKVILPSSALEEILQSNQDPPSPLTFELRHPHNSSNVVHAGVKEFSSEGDFIQLPAWMREYLELSVGSRVLIKLRSLPKGTWAKLRLLSPDYNDIRDYRAALEAHLRTHYITLTAGQTLSCRYGSKTYPFLVVDLKPEPAVCITDTDLEVDLETTPEQYQTMQQSNEKTLAKLNEPISGISVEKGAYKYCKLVATENATSVELQVTVESGIVDVIINTSAEDYQRPTLENHEYSDFSTASNRRIALAPSKEYIVGIHGYTDAVVSWVAKLRDNTEEDMMAVDNNELHANEAGYVQCKNCRSWVPERIQMLHEGFCMRNNILCPEGCGRVLKKGSAEAEQHWHCEQCEYVGETSDKAKHMEYYHSPKTCVCQDFTSESYEALSLHRRAECPEKLISCRYCHTLVAQGPPSLYPRDRLLNLHSHESYCGSRTITCQKCHKQIPIKDIQVHAKIHEVERQNQRLPPLCSNRNCVRLRAKNKLGLCQYCFGPFWVTDDDPKNVKLMQRVARKLHSQLTTGCGHAYCRNKYCATGTQKPQDANTAATTLIPMVQSVQRQLGKPSPDPELYLCVDEATTRKKFLAETLVEGTQGQYTLPWCVKALESEDEDLERAKRWLNSNAPRNTISKETK